MKTYFVKTEKNISDEDCVLLSGGVELDTWYKTLPWLCKKLSANELELSISEWKFHQVKKMLEAIWNKVEYLKRTKIGWCDISLLWDEKWKEYTVEELSGILFG